MGLDVGADLPASQPLVLSLSKHWLAWPLALRGEEGRPFDRLRASGLGGEEALPR